MLYISGKAPKDLSSEERRREIASLLARGAMRYYSKIVNKPLSMALDEQGKKIEKKSLASLDVLNSDASFGSDK